MKSIFRNYNCSWSETFLLILFFLLLGWAIVSQVWGTGWSIWFDTNGLDHIGSFMGGLFAVLSIYYLIKNLAEQRHITSIQSFESNYLEIVKFCRAQVEQAHVPNPDSSKEDRQQIIGKDVFNLFFHQIEVAIEELKTYMQDKTLNDFFITQNEFERQQQIWGNKLQDRTISSIAYLITYSGVRNLNANLLEKKYLSQYNPNHVNKLLSLFKKKLAQYAPENLRNYIGDRLHQTDIQNCDDKAYYGFQDEIGNYFRLLFQAIEYVDNQPFLSYKEKYKYIKMLRGQMSNMEEAVLFYNSLCDLGLAWEYGNHEKGKDLITKYNLIKNIPANLTKISFEEFYPNVYYEYFKEQPSNRKDYDNR